MKKQNKIILFFITLVFIFSSILNVHADNNILENYSDIRDKDISQMNMNSNIDPFTFTFDDDTKWPTNLPGGFDAKKVLEYGKNPGLGIRDLQNQGINGDGVSVAIIDQPLYLSHEEFKNMNLHYSIMSNSIDKTDTSMHGNSVLSILAGKSTGVAPKSEVYFFAEPSWEMDQMNEINCFKKIIEINKTLPDNKKIKIVSLSHGKDTRFKNYDKYDAAVKELEDAGVMLFDVNTLNSLAAYIKPYTDKDDFNNYSIENWCSGLTADIYVPAGGIVTATGYNRKENSYAYYGRGGMSWTVPYEVGVAILALQINPNLTKADIINYMLKTVMPSSKIQSGGVINPKGFTEAIKNITPAKQQTIPQQTDNNDSNIYYGLYNKNKLNQDDISSIENYCKNNNFKLIDTSNYSNATQIYDMLKQDGKNIKGIQIFGISEYVPAFNINLKAQTTKEIDTDGELIKTDYFYNNLDNDSSTLNLFNVYDNFANNLNVNLNPKWPVVRLPLSNGEFTKFLNKYKDYKSKNSPIPLVNFSNPIFPSSNSSDDMGTFLNRMSNEFCIIKNNQYKLYGNLQGAYPVSNKVLGDFDKENVAKENSLAVNQYIINTHGQDNNIDGVIFDKDGKEQRKSLMNSDNINDVLNKNYYQLDLWECWPARGLSNNNILHQALANGKCVDALGNSYLLFANGANNAATLDNLSKNNFYNFYYWLLKGMYKDGLSKTQSFLIAQQKYYQGIMQNTDNVSDHNYQYNMYNLLCYHHLGLINDNPLNINIDNNSSNTHNTNEDDGYILKGTLLKNKGDNLTMKFTNKVKSCSIRLSDSNGSNYNVSPIISGYKVIIHLDTSLKSGKYILYIDSATNTKNKLLPKKYKIIINFN